VKQKKETIIINDPAKENVDRTRTTLLVARVRYTVRAMNANATRRTGSNADGRLPLRRRWRRWPAVASAHRQGDRLVWHDTLAHPWGPVVVVVVVVVVRNACRRARTDGRSLFRTPRPRSLKRYRARARAYVYTCARAVYTCAYRLCVCVCVIFSVHYYYPARFIPILFFTFTIIIIFIIIRYARHGHAHAHAHAHTIFGIPLGM